MAVTEKITCDICGIQKGEANHWMMWRTASDPDANEGAGGIQFAAWHPAHFRDYSHLCGESCAARLLSRYFAEWSAQADSPRRLPLPIEHHHTLLTQ